MFLELIPPDQLSAQQKALLQPSDPQRKPLPLYRLLREPTYLQDIDWYQYRDFCIYRENGTTISLCHDRDFYPPTRRSLSFWLHEDGLYLSCIIVGTTDAAVAETATYFWSIPSRDTFPGRLHLRHKCPFEFRALEPEQLAQILDANPRRCLDISAYTFTVQQSMVLATRPHPVRLRVVHGGLAFEDDGTAFVDALEQRQASYGELDIECNTDGMPFSRNNLRRLLQLDILDRLILSPLAGELALLPFSAKVKALDYSLDASFVNVEDLRTLQIVTKDLNVKIYLDDDDEFAYDFPLAFLDRLAELGHLEKLEFVLDNCSHAARLDELEALAEALARVIRNNPNLTCLNLSEQYMYFDWSPCLGDVFEAMEEHEGLRKVILKEYPKDEDPGYRWLEKLLMRNRNIVVLDSYRRKCTDGSRINKLYALNALYNGSPKLVKESASLRPPLVTEALMENASENFVHTALLLSYHTDILNELLSCASLDNVAGAWEIRDAL